MSHLHPITKILNCRWRFFQFKWIYKYRKTSLALSAGISILLFCLFLCFWPDIACYIGTDEDFNNRIKASLSLLCLGLPIAYLLWLFRTHDTLENLHRRSFFDALKLLTSEEGSAKGMGLKQILFLRSKVKGYESEIDNLTPNLNLKGAYLKKAELQGVKLQGANLQEAKLQGADLRGAQLQEAELQKANLQEAQLQEAELQWAQLYQADLQKANLQWAHFQEANFQEANFQEANFQEADLRGAHLRGAKLEGADLRGAELQGANLQGAQLYQADLQKAHLQGAQLQEANLRGAQLRGAHYDKETMFPDGFSPANNGMEEVS